MCQGVLEIILYYREIPISHSKRSVKSSNESYFAITNIVEDVGTPITNFPILLLFSLHRYIGWSLYFHSYQSRFKNGIFLVKCTISFWKYFPHSADFWNISLKSFENAPNSPCVLETEICFWPWPRFSE